MRRYLLILLGLMAFAGIGAAIAFGLLLKALERPYAGFEGELLFDYAEGTPTRQLAEQLEQAGVVESQYLFLAARVLRADAVLQAGEYQFRGPASVWDVYQKLAEGRVYLRALTIPEGLTRFEVAALVAEAGYGSLEEALALTANPAPISDLFPGAQTLEGCLLPETYFFPRGATAATVVSAMTAGFRKAFEQAAANKTTTLEPYEALIMASLIERRRACRPSVRWSRRCTTTVCGSGCGCNATRRSSTG